MSHDKPIIKEHHWTRKKKPGPVDAWGDIFGVLTLDSSLVYVTY